MGLRGTVRQAGGFKNVVKNPAKAAGAVAGGAVAAAGHPYVAAAVAKGTEKAVNKGIKFAQKPEVQARVKEVGATAVSGALQLGNDAAGRAKTFASAHGFNW